MQILGSLLKTPMLLAESSIYNLTKDDFPEKFHKVVFAALNNLYQNGNEVINEIVIDGFLQDYAIQYAIFNDNNGLEYLEKISEMSEESNFDYYYNRVKKFSLVREMDGLGFNIQEIYDIDIIDPKEQEEMQEKFDSYSVNDILKIYELKMLEVKDRFKSNSDTKSSKVGDGLRNYIQSLKDDPDFGTPLNSKMLTSIFRGARRKKYYIRSAITGGGKTRHAVADACFMGSTHIYNIKDKKWEENNIKESSIVISTEMLTEELQTMAVAYISGVDEENIVYNNLTKDEDERIQNAITVLENSNIWFVEMPNFNVKDIEQEIEKHVLYYDIGNVFFDYIHSSVKVFSEITKESGIGLREDQILLLMSIKLKEICNKYGVFLMSATQLNGEWKEAWKKGDIIDSTFIRGGKGIIDKADGAMIILPISRIESKAIEPILHERFGQKPNQVTHIYKNRGNRIDKAKIFSYVNMGNMRVEDLFATNTENELITIKEVKIEMK